MYLITYYCENPLFDGGGKYGSSIEKCPIEFLDIVEEEKSDSSRIFLINVLPITDEQAETIGEFDAID